MGEAWPWPELYHACLHGNLHLWHSSPCSLRKASMAQRSHSKAASSRETLQLADRTRPDSSPTEVHCWEHCICSHYVLGATRAARRRFGMGHIYYRQEKYGMAEYHFRRALNINPRSSVLRCYLGMALHKLRRNAEALEMLQARSQGLRAVCFCCGPGANGAGWYVESLLPSAELDGALTTCSPSAWLWILRPWGIV
jgi:hypothetical protein